MLVRRDPLDICQGDAMPYMSLIALNSTLMEQIRSLIQRKIWEIFPPIGLKLSLQSDQVRQDYSRIEYGFHCIC